MKFEIAILKGQKEIALIKGERDIKYSDITEKELIQVIETETLLEKLTGFRFHINCIRD